MTKIIRVVHRTHPRARRRKIHQPVATDTRHIERVRRRQVRVAQPRDAQRPIVHRHRSGRLNGTPAWRYIMRCTRRRRTARRGEQTREKNTETPPPSSHDRDPTTPPRPQPETAPQRVSAPGAHRPPALLPSSRRTRHPPASRRPNHPMKQVLELRRISETCPFARNRHVGGSRRDACKGRWLLHKPPTGSLKPF